MTDLVGKRLGEFEILTLLGRGGMGVVYEAVQTSLNRRVALKVLGPGLGLTPQAVDRFKREAEAAARLNHTNIVPVYATGEQGGTHFYAMELIDGPGLDVVIRHLRERQTAPAGSVPTDLAATALYVAPDPLPPAPGSAASGSAADRFDRVAAVVADAGDALHHAHQSGITHRDVKPSNLLLAADGRVRVTDFGLARMLEQPGVTVTGEFVGTPAYMSPEQITAGRVQVDHRTDVYSLGATLYELLTLRPPFVADGRDRLLAMVIQKDPPSVRSLAPKVPRDLETICLKALDKDPDRRYQAAGNMAQDLRRYLNRFAILARPAGPLARAAKWARRNPAVAGLIAVAVLAAGAAGVFVGEQRKQADRRRAEEARLADEVRQEKLRGAMDRALIATMADRLDTAEEAVRETEELGASVASVRRLRGQIALLRNDYTAAVEELSHATRLQPEAVAGWALLATAHYFNGDEMSYLRILNGQLEGGVPRTAEDHLFLGQAIAAWDPGRAVPLMQRAIELRDGAVPRSIRGATLCEAGLQAESPDLVETGVLDTRIARELAGPGNRRAVMNSLNAHTAAALVFEAVGRPEKANEYWDLARADERLVGGFPPSAIHTEARASYARVAGTDELAILRDGLRVTPNVPLANYHAARVCRDGTPDDVRGAMAILDRALEEHPASDVLHTHKLLLMSLAPSADSKQLRAAFQRYSSQCDDPTQRLFAVAALLLNDEREWAARELKALERATFPVAIRSTYEALRDHLAGSPVGERDVIGTAKVDRELRCEISFFLGVHQLSLGDRAAAARHFRDGATRYRCPEFMATPWCMAFRARIEGDPAWPARVGQKKK